MKKRKWPKVVAIVLIAVIAAGFGAFKLMDYFGRRAMMKMQDKLMAKIESGEIKIPDKLPVPQDVLQKYADEMAEKYGTDPESAQQNEQSPDSETASDESAQPEQSDSSASQGAYTGGTVDMSYASQVAEIASAADVATAYSVVLGCLSAEDKAQIAQYLAAGDEGSAYSLVASRITGDAYQTLLGLYCKYLPMVQ